jgi:hypothetical protein
VCRVSYWKQRDVGDTLDLQALFRELLGYAVSNSCVYCVD